MPYFNPLLFALNEPRNAGRLRGTFWLFLHLVVLASPRTGRVTTTVGALASQTGLSGEAVRSQLGHLRASGFVQVRKGDTETLVISFNAPRLGPRALDKPAKAEPTGNVNGPMTNSQTNTTSNNNPMNNNNATAVAAAPMPPRDPNRVNRWAQRIVQALGEQTEANLNAYAELAENTSDEVLEKALEEVLKVPAYRIRRSRSALFSYLVRDYSRRE